jgi:archaellum component FlaC
MFEKDPRTFGPSYNKLMPEQKALVKLEITLTNFFREFNKSISRWERMVYPAMILLGILGLSGFYLIYHLTNDMHDMSLYMDPEMASNLSSMAGYMRDLSNNIQTMTGQIATLTETITSMEAEIAHMDGNIGQMNQSIHRVASTMDVMTDKVIDITDSVAGVEHSVGVMTGNIVEMNQSMKAITVNTGVMTRDMGGMNQSISRPANFMNQFAPW